MSSGPATQIQYCPQIGLTEVIDRLKNLGRRFFLDDTSFLVKSLPVLHLAVGVILSVSIAEGQPAAALMAPASTPPTTVGPQPPV